MFLKYLELFNSFDSDATTKITINNRHLNRLDFENTILIPKKNDELSPVNIYPTIYISTNIIFNTLFD